MKLPDANMPKRRFLRPVGNHRTPRELPGQILSVQEYHDHDVLSQHVMGLQVITSMAMYHLLRNDLQMDGLGGTSFQSLQYAE